VYARVVVGSKNVPPLLTNHNNKSKDLKGSVLLIDTNNTSFNNLAGLHSLVAIAVRSGAIAVLVLNAFDPSTDQVSPVRVPVPVPVLLIKRALGDFIVQIVSRSQDVRIKITSLAATAVSAVPPLLAPTSPPPSKSFFSRSLGFIFGGGLSFDIKKKLMEVSGDYTNRLGKYESILDDFDAAMIKEPGDLEGERKGLDEYIRLKSATEQLLLLLLPLVAHQENTLHIFEWISVAFWDQESSVAEFETRLDAVFRCCSERSKTYLDDFCRSVISNHSRNVSSNSLLTAAFVLLKGHPDLNVLPKSFSLRLQQELSNRDRFASPADLQNFILKVAPLLSGSSRNEQLLNLALQGCSNIKSVNEALSLIETLQYPPVAEADEKISAWSPPPPPSDQPHPSTTAHGEENIALITKALKQTSHDDQNDFIDFMAHLDRLDNAYYLITPFVSSSCSYDKQFGWSNLTEIRSLVLKDREIFERNFSEVLFKDLSSSTSPSPIHVLSLLDSSSLKSIVDGLPLFDYVKKAKVNNEDQLNPLLKLFSHLHALGNDVCSELSSFFHSYYEEESSKHRPINLDKFSATLRAFTEEVIELPSMAGIVCVPDNIADIISGRYQFRKLRGRIAEFLVADPSLAPLDIFSTFSDRLLASDANKKTLCARIVEVFDSNLVEDDALTKLCRRLLALMFPPDHALTMSDLMKSPMRELVIELGELSQPGNIRSEVKPLVMACQDFADALKSKTLTREIIIFIDEIPFGCANRIASSDAEDGIIRTCTYASIRAYDDELVESIKKLRDMLQVYSGFNDKRVTMARLLSSFGNSGDKDLDKIINILEMELKPDSSYFSFTKNALTELRSMPLATLSSYLGSLTSLRATRFNPQRPRCPRLLGLSRF
jgi:hypothetical protein